MTPKQRQLLRMIFDGGTAENEKLSAITLLLKSNPDILDALLMGKATPKVETVERVVERTVRVEVPPKNYDALVKIATELTEIKIQALQNGIENYGNRFMRVIEVRAHLSSLGKTPEDFGITEAQLAAWEEAPPKNAMDAIGRRVRKLFTQPTGPAKPTIDMKL